jgi:hypothetical protein
MNSTERGSSSGEMGTATKVGDRGVDWWLYSQLSSISYKLMIWCDENLMFNNQFYFQVSSSRATWLDRASRRSPPGRPTSVSLSAVVWFCCYCVFLIRSYLFICINAIAWFLSHYVFFRIHSHLIFFLICVVCI